MPHAGSAPTADRVIRHAEMCPAPCLSLDRTGIIDTSRGSTSADVFAGLLVSGAGLVYEVFRAFAPSEGEDSRDFPE
jgi:hypothetical protein